MSEEQVQVNEPVETAAEPVTLQPEAPVESPVESPEVVEFKDGEVVAPAPEAPAEPAPEAAPAEGV